MIALEARGKWPHIRSNWVTKNNDVLQVTGRSSQPWIESNAALVRIAQASQPESAPALTYAWTPITLSDKDEGPAARGLPGGDCGSRAASARICCSRFTSAFSSGCSWVNRRLAPSGPQIRRYMEFYSWSLPGRYRPVANIGVVTANPMQWFEVMNLLMRHNLPFELVAPAELPKRDLGGLKLLIVPGEPDRAQRDVLTEFSRTGGAVKVVDGPVDPNRFALDVRQLLGRERRVVDIWNGITVLAAPYAEANGTSAMLTVLNYAHQSLPVQLRIAGTYLGGPVRVARGTSRRCCRTSTATATRNSCCRRCGSAAACS